MFIYIYILFISTVHVIFLYTLLLPEPCMTPPKYAGLNLRSMFQTFLQRHSTLINTNNTNMKTLCSIASKNYTKFEKHQVPQMPARNKEKQHHRTTRPLFWDWTSVINKHIRITERGLESLRTMSFKCKRTHYP